MRRLARRRWAILSALLGLALVWTPAAGQSKKTIDGVMINLGIVPAAVALRANGHRDMHPSHPPPGSQHVLVTLDQAEDGKRIGDAEVVVEIIDPHGGVEKKALLHTQADGFPDYSELFRFGWSGEYSIRVIVTLKGAVKPIEARYTVVHSI
jgi:hypothetical protein